MILIAITIVSLASAWLMAAWRNVEGTILRWKLFAIRDRLRMVAIDRKPLPVPRLFHRLDRALSNHCNHLGYLSFWTLLPMLFGWKSRQQDHEMKEFGRAMDRPENREFAVCYHDATREIQRYLLKRHILVVVLLLPTVIGLWFLIRGMRTLASEVAAGTIEPAGIGGRRARVLA